VRVKDRGRTDETSTFLSRVEADALIGASGSCAVAFAVFTGLRSGELRALRWEDVADTHVIVRYGEPGKPTKNGKIRRVPLLAGARAALKVMRGDDKKKAGLVFRSVRGERLAKGQIVPREDWIAWLAKAKIKRRVRWHDLRHTCATLLLSGAWGRKWTLEEVKEMLGHSSVKVTERYAKATGTLADAAAAEMTSPELYEDEVKDLLEKTLRRGSGSNRRMTVLQTREDGNAGAGMRDVWGPARAYLEAVLNGDPFERRRGIDLARAFVELAQLEAMALAQEGGG
jgi:hypothetical protein